MMYQYNDRLTQLFTKYKYIWLWLQCFDPYLGHHQAYIMNLESIVHVWIFYVLAVNMLAPCTQVRGFEPGRNRRIFRAKKIPQHAFLRRGSKAVCPMSQICGMLKIPAIYVEVGIARQINWPFLAQFRPSLTEFPHVA
jgi:hypothetical protein